MSTAASEQIDEDPQDVQLIEQLGRGISVAESARRVGISERTVYRRLENSDFKAKVQKYRQEVLDCATARLTSKLGRAISTLSELLSSKSDVVKLQAAKCIVELAIKTRTLYEHEQRLNDMQAELRAVLAKAR